MRTSIHLNPSSVQVETVHPGGKRSIKNTTIEALQSVLTRGERIETPLLPFGWGVQKYTKIDNREQYVIATPSARITSYFDMRSETGEDERAEYDIVTPACLWFIHTSIDAQGRRRYRHGMAYAIKQQILTENDRLYRLPFSNTNDGYICWGNESDYPVLSGSKSIQTIPDRFFSNPFNNDLDGGKFERFKDEVDGRHIFRERTIHLLQYLDKETKLADAEGRQAKFNNDILIPRMTLREAIDQWRREQMRG